MKLAKNMTQVDALDIDAVLVTEPKPSPVIYGTEGNDYDLQGTDANDTIYGLGGRDQIYGGNGNDTLNGGFGDDFLFGGMGADVIVGGPGIDTAVYVDASAGVALDLVRGGRGGEALGDTFTEIENVLGSEFDDIIAGNEADNYLQGARGDDHLMGAGGSDVLFGGDGADTLTGGGGTDIFVLALDGLFFTSMNDTIVDFQSGVDKVQLHEYESYKHVFGGDHQLAQGFFDGANWSTQNYDDSDLYFFDGTNDQLIWLGEGATLSQRIADGTVAATFATDVWIGNSDFLLV